MDDVERRLAAQRPERAHESAPPAGRARHPGCEASQERARRRPAAALSGGRSIDGEHSSTPHQLATLDVGVLRSRRARFVREDPHVVPPLEQPDDLAEDERLRQLGKGRDERRDPQGAVHWCGMDTMVGCTRYLCHREIAVRALDARMITSSRTARPMLSRLLDLLGVRPTTRQRLRYPSIDGLLSVRPKSDHWGWDRGTPVDRFYIDRFLAEHAGDVRGNALEVKDADYTKRYGRDVVRADVLDIDADNPQATIIADLSTGEGIPESFFDCFILTQTLQYIYDLRGAVAQCERLLRPGGVLLVTVPCLSRITHGAAIEWDYWRFTGAACRRLFGDGFGDENVEVRTHGNVLAATAFLRGTALDEIPRRKLEVNDPYFPLLVTVRAVKRRLG
jgi:SAM-dependent methyltransferase